MKKARSILITGCSSGIGYTCAHGLQKQGYNVFATCRKDEDVKRLQAEGLNACKLDLCDSGSLHVALAWMLSQTDGRIDVLFNNASFGQPGAVEDLKRDVLREQFETNVFGSVELTNLVLPYMRKQGHGRIIFNSSILGFVAMSYRGAYNASKFAIEGLADTLRLELHGSGVDVVLIEPGPIRSHFRKNALAKFLANIDQERSAHKVIYEKTLERLQKSGDSAFTLGAEAVLKVLVEAIESKKPKFRYPVTFPTKLFTLLKRILPTCIMDSIARKAGE
ncbi:putative NAD(P)-dependent oxidoreductase YbbO-like [Sulfurospirillum diekertiae]|uniref:NAD(P)-dependent oxidoreductase YbbO-like n=1 Tax=Sulfurospirillum diekertiae TaxID=1854492 RepID=A0A290HVS2_9BACT|nr:SDR family oxidoreductase [Sulfurospirillum diekertiae]ATB70744.1 putative NAD(P)-dependent oxidoreductase YbbO-like [Sulfurospirillum diekertiae]